MMGSVYTEIEMLTRHFVKCKIGICYFMHRRLHWNWEVWRGVSKVYAAMNRKEIGEALQDAGCSAEDIASILASLADAGQFYDCLSRYRAALLEEVHQAEKKIDCLDYLVYRMQGIHHNKKMRQRKDCV